jgi:hypothetical protein
VTALVRVFVARDGNGFMRDIADWIAEAATIAGRDATVVDDRLPAVDGSINLVVAPHELFELSKAPKADLQRAAAASVCVCTEQPWTPWFHLSTDACRRGLLTLDISSEGAGALRSIGIDAERLVLGAVPSMRDDAGCASGSSPTSPHISSVTAATSDSSASTALSHRRHRASSSDATSTAPCRPRECS